MAQDGMGRLMRQSLFLAAVCVPLFLTGCTSLETLSSAEETSDPRIVSSLPADTSSIRTNAVLVPEQVAPEPVTIRIAGDRGGHVIVYAMQMMKWRDDGTRVRFSGRCESACTLYLALPADQICVTPQASFRFHTPIARGEQSMRRAERYMLDTYPDWVNSWIERQGGLSRRLIAMDYAYARKFIRDCAPVTTARLRVASLPQR